MVHSFLLKTAGLASSALLASVAAKTGFPAPGTVCLTHPSNSYAEILTFGAQVISFHSATDPHRNVLFMSNSTDGTGPTRGGIPVIFPNYRKAQGFPAPDNGIARVSEWEVVSVVVATDVRKDSVATFRLMSTEATRKLWPHDFVLEYEVKLWTAWIETTLTVHNVNPVLIEFQALFHNYIQVNDIVRDGLSIENLDGVQYFDKLTNTERTETRKSFGIMSEVDGIFKNVERDVVVRVPGGGCNQIVTINKSAWFDSDTVTPINTPTDCVLWNPWKEGAAKMTGFDDTEYLYMAVIGPGRVSENQLLASGMYYKLNQIIMVSKDV